MRKLSIFLLVYFAAISISLHGRPIEQMNHYELILKQIELNFNCVLVNRSLAALAVLQTTSEGDSDSIKRQESCNVAKVCLDELSSQIAGWKTGKIRDSYKFREPMGEDKLIQIYKSDYLAPFEGLAQKYSAIRKDFEKGICGYKVQQQRFRPAQASDASK